MYTNTIANLALILTLHKLICIRLFYMTKVYSSESRGLCLLIYNIAKYFYPSDPLIMIDINYRNKTFLILIFMIG